jgi:hypothetical protein
MYFPAGLVPPLFHLTCSTPTKSNLYLESSLQHVIREPALHKLLMFQVSNLICLFYRSDCLPKKSTQVRGSLQSFITGLFFYDEG